MDASECVDVFDFVLDVTLLLDEVMDEVDDDSNLHKNQDGQCGLARTSTHSVQ